MRITLKVLSMVITLIVIVISVLTFLGVTILAAIKNWGRFAEENFEEYDEDYEE